MTLSKQIVIVAIVAAVGGAGYYSWPVAKTDAASSKAAFKAPRQPGVVEASAATVQRMERVIEAVGTTRQSARSKLPHFRPAVSLNHSYRREQKSNPALY